MAVGKPIDLWRSAIIRCPADELDQQQLDSSQLIWLANPGSYVFHADPFGLWRDGQLHVFVETMDYRQRVGHIDFFVYDSSLQLCSSGTALREPWHLSYPFVFEANGETWMLPEAYRSGTLTLYRARRFPHEWEPACTIPLDGPAIDATPVRFAGRWWLFYAPYGDPVRRRSHLHLAWAEELTGPWHLHPMNPVRVDLASTRPGGTPLIVEGQIELPVQDCRATYGGAIRRLRVTRLDEARFEADDESWLSPPDRLSPFLDGLHTLSAAGSVSLIDVKQIDDSWMGNVVRLRGVVSRHLRERRRR
jgi:hypothetical protein